MKGIIYKWTCNINGKSYIGQTVNEKRRERDFLDETKSYAGEKINNARKKYGLSDGAWTKTVLKRLWCKNGRENELRERLNYWERYYIEQFDTIKNGYNITNGGDCDFSQEVIEEMRRKSFEHWNNMSDEEKTKCIENGKQWWNSLSNVEKNKFISNSKEKYKKWYNSLPIEEKEKYKMIARNANLGLHHGHSISRSINSSNAKKGLKRLEETKEKIRKTLLDKEIKYKIERSEKNPEGCYFIPRINRWRSTIYYKGEKRLLGHFETPQAASEIHEIAKKKKEEGIFDKWYENIHSHKIEIFKKFGEKTCN